MTTTQENPLSDAPAVETTPEATETAPETVETAPETVAEPVVDPEVAAEPTATPLEVAKEYAAATNTPLAEAERLANLAAANGEELNIPPAPDHSLVGKEFTTNGIKYRRQLNELGIVVDVKI